MMAKVISNSLSSFSHSGFQKYCATTSQQTRQVLKLDFSLSSIKRENNKNQKKNLVTNKTARSIDLLSCCSSLDSEMDTDDRISKSGHHLIDDDDDDDEKSRCSEDSELSVGQEDLCDNDEIIINTNNHVKSTISLNNKKIDKLSVTSSCNSANVNIHNEMVDDVEDEISNQSSSRCTVTSSTLCSPKESFKINCDNVIRVPVMRPSPTRFHEEFLRSSQLYAEELMRQQMSIVAAARGIQMSTKLNTDPTSVVLQNPISNPLAIMPTTRLDETNNSTSLVDSSLSIMSFRPLLRNQGEQENNNSLPVRTEHLNFRNLHSHLNAISQITNNLTSDIRKITSPSLSSITSRESSQSPPNYQLHPQNFFNHHQNQINEQNLKFSIDNILKADFGRRITEPLLKSAKNKRLHHREHKNARDINKKHITSPVTPIDLTSNIPSATPPVSTPTPPCQTPASESGSSGSQSTVWPAWVNKHLKHFSFISIIWITFSKTK